MSHSANRRGILIGFLVSGITLGGVVHAEAASTADEPLSNWVDRFSLEVDHRLDVPPAAQQQYIGLLQQTLADAKLAILSAQAVLVVDRSPYVQGAFVVVLTPSGQWHWIGATAVSTGKIGTFEHFRTPLGAFAHSLGNPDYRSQGTYNKNHIRGYGLRGMRVFDFGWQLAERGWGAGGSSKMRLEMHATDPHVLEGRLGQVGSEGCVRIPATLNKFLDRHGVLDADYEAEKASGKALWVLTKDRQVIRWPGRYLVVIDSNADARPLWAPLPGTKVPTTAAAWPRSDVSH